MTFDFPLLLTILLIVSAVVGGLDKWYFEPRRKQIYGESAKMPKLAEYARSFFSVFLIVYIVRAFIMQPFYTPTGSLEPTLMPGDFSLVTQFNYGLRIPVWNWKIVPIGEPKRGDIMVFQWPVNPHVDLVKRVIGLPGDHISYINKVLYINGKAMTQTYVGVSSDQDNADGPSWPVNVYQENLDGAVHKIFINPKIAAQNFKDLVVPPGEYFMMGDNRDNSDDSRDWGFAADSYILGKAEFIFFSWDPMQHRVNWSRIGTKL